jgi:competence protein CoiA
MLKAIHIGTGEKLYARAVSREDGPFACPGCALEVVPKKGEKKIHHFAHKSVVSCHWGRGESEEHRQCKQEIYDALATVGHVSGLELERDLGPVVADIYAEFRGARVAIEVQRSDLSDAAIAARTAAYDKLGIFVLWVALNPAKHGERFSPSSWQKWAHAAYFGRIFYWAGGLDIIPVHFDAYTEQRGGKTYFLKGYLQLLD